MDATPRPLRADARRNRERVLRAADELFAAGGLSVPLDEIARRAGVGPGTVHRHFPAKEDLVAAIVADRMRQVIDAGRERVRAADPGAALQDMITLMLSEGMASQPLKAALAGTGLDLRTAAPDLAGQLREVLATLLTRAQDTASVRGDLDVDLLALVAGAFATLRHAGAEAETGRASRLTRVLFDGLRGSR